MDLIDYCNNRLGVVIIALQTSSVSCSSSQTELETEMLMVRKEAISLIICSKREASHVANSVPKGTPCWKYRLRLSCLVQQLKAPDEIISPLQIMAFIISEKSSAWKEGWREKSERRERNNTLPETYSSEDVAHFSWEMYGQNDIEDYVCLYACDKSRREEKEKMQKRRRSDTSKVKKITGGWKWLCLNETFVNTSPTFTSPNFFISPSLFSAVSLCFSSKFMPFVFFSSFLLQ